MRNVCLLPKVAVMITMVVAVMVEDEVMLELF